jgi:hypothetical protein
MGFAIVLIGRSNGGAGLGAMVPCAATPTTTRTRQPNTIDDILMRTSDDP